MSPAVMDTGPADASPPEYAAYTDEAQHNFGRVRGVGAVSVRTEHADQLAGEVAALLGASGISECKWELVRSARASFAAAKLITWTLDRALDGQLCVDVLTWSAEDAAARRQAIPSLARLRQMYARLLDIMIRDRGLAGSRWSIYPDEQQALDWGKIVASMTAGAQIARIAPQRSHEAPLIQVADLFVGLGVFSRDAYDAYQRWRAFPDEERNVATGRLVPLGMFTKVENMPCARITNNAAANRNATPN